MEYVEEACSIWANTQKQQSTQRWIPHARWWIGSSTEVIQTLAGGLPRVVCDRPDI